MLKHKIATMKLTDLTPAEYNPRKISPRAMEGLQHSLKEFGLVQPIIFNERSKRVVGGHQRVKALQANGETEANVVLVDLPESKEKALNVALNNPYIAGDWNDEVYALLHSIQTTTPDLFSGLMLDEIAMFRQRDNPLDIPNVDGDGAAASSLNDLFSADEIVEDAMQYFRKRGFPYPHMELFEMKQELNRLANLPLENCVRSTIGYRIADHFNPHRFHATAKGRHSPIDAFAKDTSLRKALEMNYKESRNLPTEYFPFLAIVHGAQECSNFRPAFARMLYEKWSPKGGKVLDPCTGYGGRLVGFLASHAAVYTGVDPNTPTYKGNLALAKTLCLKKKVTLIHSPFEDVQIKDIPYSGEYDLAFTSPPYFSKEVYSDEKTNSSNRFPGYEDWKKGFLAPMMTGCFKTLRKGGRAIMNVADIKIGKETFPLESDTVAAGRKAGFNLIDTSHFPIANRTMLDKSKEFVISKPAEELVFVFEKPNK